MNHFGKLRIRTGLQRGEKLLLCYLLSSMWSYPVSIWYLSVLCTYVCTSYSKFFLLLLGFCFSLNYAGLCQLGKTCAVTLSLLNKSVLINAFSFKSIQVKSSALSWWLSQQVTKPWNCCNISVPMTWMFPLDTLSTPACWMREVAMRTTAVWSASARTGLKHLCSGTVDTSTWQIFKIAYFLICCPASSSSLRRTSRSTVGPG